MPGRLLALDLGTTSVRALVVSDEGRISGRARRALPTRYPAPGRVEQDGDEMVGLAIEVAREAIAASETPPGELAGLGIVTQRGTTLAWDARTLAPLAPAIGWQDRRAAARAGELLRQGVPIHSLASATKLEWWLREEPAIRRAADAGTLRFGTPDTWIAQRLSGGETFATDATQACATGLYDYRTGGWSERILSLLGIDATWLPSIVATDAVVGASLPDLFGAPLPLAARAGDQQAACFAQAVLRPGEAKITLGTSAMLDRHEGAAPPGPRRGAYPLVLSELSDAGRTFCSEGTVITTGAAVDWMVEIGVLPSADALDAMARKAPSSDGVCFVPALQGIGTPAFDDSARGLLGGLTRGTRPEHLARALLEGIAQRCADVCEALGPFDGPLRVDGGLARSDLLLQELADLSGLELWRAAETETTALGAALLAAHGTGLLSTADVPRVIGAPQVVEPRLAAPLRDARRARWSEILRRAS